MGFSPKSYRDKELSLNYFAKRFNHELCDRRHFDRTLNDCFFSAPGIKPGLAHLKAQLAATHFAEGFEPLQLEGFSNEFDPLDLIGAPQPDQYDAVIVAVGHRQFADIGSVGIRAFGKPSSVLYDVKYVLPRDAVDGRL